VSAVVGLFLLGGVAGAAIAFVYQAYRDGRRVQGLVVALVAAAIVGYLLWTALMVGSVGPTMRGTP
jgi:dolichol kinase